MPINAGAIGIQPVGPQRPAGGVDGIQRRDDGTAGGFRPQTEISLKTAIEDLAAMLGRISSQEKFGVERLPANIAQVVRNILQQSLSMEETLAQGIGSTIESQRFSTEQLSIFARMLAQIGALAEKGFSMELSDETKALLTQFKSVVVASEGGRAFEPVLMSKAAFELVDSKMPEQLPPALLEMLTQSSPQSSEPAQFLRQLVDLLMPKPAAEGSAQVPQQEQAQQQAARPNAMQQRLNVTYRQFDAPYSQAKQSTPPVAQNLSNANQQPVTGQAPLSAPAQTSAENIQQPPIQSQSATSNQQPATGQAPLSAPAQTSAENIQQPPVQSQPATTNQQPAAGQAPLSAPAQTSAENIQQPPTQSQLATANQQPVAGQAPLSAPAQTSAENIKQPPAQSQPATPNQQPAVGQAPLSSPAQTSAENIQQPPVQSQPATPNPQPVAGQAPLSAPAQTSAANIQQPPAQSQPATANQQPVTGQTSLSAPAQTSTENIQQPPAQSQPATPNQQPVAGQAPLSAPVQSQPATPNQQAQPSTSSTQTQQPSQAETPRDEFTISLPRKPQPSPVDEDFVARQRELMAQMQFAKTQLLQQPIQNTPQTTDALKNLAQFLMRNPASAESMSQRETTLLQNFVNNQQTVLPRDEARHLQNLLRLCQQNVPAVVQQAAAQHKLPDLPRLWAFMQLCDMASLPAHMSARALKRAAREVSDFSNVMRQAMGGDNTTVQNQRSFQMMLPLYLGENIASYPTYLSVYDETARDKDTGVEKKETWLRICVLTDNIGAAELIFRVYEKTQLDMRFYFSEGEVAEDFKNYVASLRNFIGGTNFSIGEIRIGSIGEKMLLAQ